jgi:hypothetical protein
MEARLKTAAKSLNIAPAAQAPAFLGVLQRKCECGRTADVSGECDECRNEHSLRGGEVPASVRDVMRDAGAPLGRESRDFFGARFGHDFSRVRIHADSRAADSAKEVGARAYTVGNHIAFGAGLYSPSTNEGRRLLAHELTHTIQQENGVAPSWTISDSAAHEGEADRAAAAIYGAGPMPVATTQVATSIARDKSEGEAAKAESKAAECPKNHTLPDDVYDAVGAAWKKSGHGGKTVTEQGGRIVTDSAGKRVIRTGSGGGGSISLPDEKTGDTTEGTFHTHPYSKSEDSELGVSFSGGDISNFVGGGQGKVKYIGAGSCYFVLDTLDQTKKDGCKKADLEKRWDESFGKPKGNFQKKVETAVKATIAGCGLCYYRTCRPNAKSAVPKTAALV